MGQLIACTSCLNGDVCLECSSQDVSSAEYCGESLAGRAARLDYELKRARADIGAVGEPEERFISRSNCSESTAVVNRPCCDRTSPKRESFHRCW
jgi:hypothetical protein